MFVPASDVAGQQLLPHEPGLELEVGADEHWLIPRRVDHGCMGPAAVASEARVDAQPRRSRDRCTLLRRWSRSRRCSRWDARPGTSHWHTHIWFTSQNRRWSGSTRECTHRARTFCVLESHRTIWPSIPAVTSRAPLGDQAKAVMSAVWPALNRRCRSQSSQDMTWTSVVFNQQVLDDVIWDWGNGTSSGSRRSKRSTIRVPHSL